MTQRGTNVKYFPNAGEYEGETDDDGSLPAIVVKHYNVEAFNVNRLGERTSDVLDDKGNPVVSRQANLVVFPPNAPPFHVSGVAHESSVFTKTENGKTVRPYHYWTDPNEAREETNDNSTSNVPVPSGSNPFASQGSF